jgi:hypothetical protein
VSWMTKRGLDRRVWRPGSASVLVGSMAVRTRTAWSLPRRARLPVRADAARRAEQEAVHPIQASAAHEGAVQRHVGGGLTQAERISRALAIPIDLEDGAAHVAATRSTPLESLPWRFGAVPCRTRVDPHARRLRERDINPTAGAFKMRDGRSSHGAGMRRRRQEHAPARPLVRLDGAARINPKPTTTNAAGISAPATMGTRAAATPATRSRCQPSCLAASIWIEPVRVPFSRLTETVHTKQRVECEAKRVLLCSAPGLAAHSGAAGALAATGGSALSLGPSSRSWVPGSSDPRSPTSPPEPPPTRASSS